MDEEDWILACVWACHFSVPIIMNAIEMTLQVPGSVIVLNQNGKQI